MKNVPCQNCGSNRWKTKHKILIAFFGSEYECRKCGLIRRISNSDRV